MITGMTASFGRAVSAESDFLFYTTYADLQAYEKSPDLRYGTNCYDIAWQAPRTAYLARNEYEGFQIFFYEKGNGRQLRVTLSPFLNQNNEELEHSVYKEIYFSPEGVSDTKVADALQPYHGEEITTVKDDNNMFYVELHSSKTQTPGAYNSVITLYDGNDVIKTCDFTVNVWNFTLPDSHYGTTVAGLYNASSGYAGTRGFLEYSGVEFDSNGEVLPESVPLAEKILEEYDEMLLEHGVSSYEIPRFMIDADEKQALLTMSDPRRSVFTVPLVSSYVSNGRLSQSEENIIRQYNSLVHNNKFLEKKAFFYTADEPNWTNTEQASGYLALVSAIRNVWEGDYHSVVPTWSANAFTREILRNTTDISCMNNSLLAYNNDAVQEFTSGIWNRTWRYQGDGAYGGTYLTRYHKSGIGIYVRVQYWQAEALNSDGILHWNACYLPQKQDGTYYDVWENNTVFPGGGITTGNGDGFLMYPSPDPETSTAPLASLRLKLIRRGMYDYDYLQLAKEFLGEDSPVYLEAMDSFSEKAVTGQEDLKWISWDCTPFNSSRISLGNALSEANTEHNYGEWETAVSCDDTHNGLEIRTCADCGAEESRTFAAVEPTVDVNGVTLTVNNLYGVKDFFVAKGLYGTYREVKNAPGSFCVTSAKIGSDHTYRYGAPVGEPGEYTLCVRYDDPARANRFIYFNCEVVTPSVDIFGKNITIGNLEGIKTIRIAPGTYSTTKEIKNAPGSRSFSAGVIAELANPDGSFTISNAVDENGADTVYSVSIDYSNLYKEIHTVTLNKLVPGYEISGDSITFTDLDGLYLLRYAPGEYGTAGGIKNAAGAKFIKGASVTGGTVTLTGLAGKYSFLVQYEENSKNIFTLDFGG